MLWKPVRIFAGILALILLALIIAALALGVLYLLLSYLIASGMTRVERAEFQDSPSDYGVEFESVSFMSRRGDVTLDGWFMRGREGMPTVIFCHGIEVGRTGDGLTELAARLNRRGFGVLQFDFRGHGLSGGKRVSSGWHERMDALGAYDYLMLMGVERGEVGMLGFSMGAASAALAAVEEPGVYALALDSTYARARDLLLGETALRTRLPAWLAAVFIPCAALIGLKLYDIDVEAMAPERAVSELGYPILAIHGAEDSRIPPAHGRRVFDAAAEGSRLWIADGVGHAGAFVANRSEYADRVAAYFLSRLRRD